MIDRRLVSLVALALGSVLVGACDLVVETIKDGVRNPAPGGGGVPGEGSGPVPPTTVDPGPAKQSCRSTADCSGGLICSTEWGGCLPVPPCAPGEPCRPVCAGTCETGKPDPTPVPPPPSRMCADTVVDGDQSTCKSQSEWKLHAYEACRARGMYLQDYSVGGGICGEGMTNQVKYVCCGQSGNTGSGAGGSSGTTTPGPSATEPASPPGTGSACFGGSEGSTSSCKSPADWKQIATERCTERGTTLTDIGLGGDCGGGNFQYMKYSCCTGSTTSK